MPEQTKPILRVVFAIVGSLAFLLGLVTIALVLVLHPTDVSQHAPLGSLLYFGIGAACAYAFFRLKRPRPQPGGAHPADDDSVDLDRVGH